MLKMQSCLSVLPLNASSGTNIVVYYEMSRQGVDVPKTV